jgi:hypothetical protein
MGNLEALGLRVIPDATIKLCLPQALIQSGDLLPWVGNLTMGNTVWKKFGSDEIYLLSENLLKRRERSITDHQSQPTQMKIAIPTFPTPETCSSDRPLVSWEQATQVT